jgi:hypothetical protein
MTTATTSTVIALFESRIAAEKAVSALVDAGFARNSMSVIARNEASATGDLPDIGPIPEVSGGTTDAGSGAAVGGLAGFVGGIIALAIPGIGPLLAVGPLAAGLLGASAGAAAGGLYGAMKDHGVPEADVSRMTDAIKRGRVLVSVHAPHDRVDQVADILDNNGALDVDEPTERVDMPTASGETPIRPLSPEAIEAVRLKPGEGVMDKVRQRERRSSIYPGFTGMGPSSTT